MDSSTMIKSIGANTGNEGSFIVSYYFLRAIYFLDMTFFFNIRKKIQCSLVETNMIFIFELKCVFRYTQLKELLHQVLRKKFYYH